MQIHVGDVLDNLQHLPNESIQCVITSPPYWGLRDYKMPGQLGLEKTPTDYVRTMVRVFEEIHRVLRDDGTVWLNLGDSYANNRTGGHGATGGRNKSTLASRLPPINTCPTKKAIPAGLKEKDLVGIPWMVAFALRDAGWYLRSDIIYSKTNPMPESVTDRPTKSHEYVFLMTKSARYYYDSTAIREPATYGQPNSPQSIKSPYGQGYARRAKIPAGWDTGPRGHHALDGRYDNSKAEKERGHKRPHEGFNGKWDQMTRAEQSSMGRNKRSVWTIATRPFHEAHFATFPEQLVEPCLLAGTSAHGRCSRCGAPFTRIEKKADVSHESESGTKYEKHSTAGRLAHLRQAARAEGREYTSDHVTVGWKKPCQCLGVSLKPCVILDPFAGAGTTGLVALKHNREFIGIELNPEYAEMAKRRIERESPLLAHVELVRGACAPSLALR